MGKVLVADNEVKLGRLVAEALQSDGHQVVQSIGGKEALSELTRGGFDVVVTDLRMADVDGMQVLTRARSMANPPEVILMTAYGSAESGVAAMKAGAADYLTKPFSLDELRLRVRRLSEQRLAEQKNERMLEQLTPGLVAAGPKMEEVLAAARKAAGSDANVLLLGESGTGKSQLARYIHYRSKRAPKPWVEIHCSALPSAQLELELFGQGGKAAKKEGLLQSAEGGTVFLDEIGEISPDTQAKLLRFVQDREFTPVGDSGVRKVDARVVAATHRDLQSMVKAGAFREDLFYRLNVVTLTVPPLRDRRDEVMPLAARILARHRMSVEQLSAAAKQRLSAHGWPGNVRELENVLARAAILSEGREIDVEALGLGGASTTQPQIAALLTEGFDLDRFERELIHAAIERSQGNKAAAARLLGITRRRLYSRLEILGRKDDPAGEEA